MGAPTHTSVAGVGRLLSGGGVRLAFGLLSAAVLIAIGARALWTGLRARAGFESVEEVVIPRRAFATATATLGTLTWYGGFATAVAVTRKRLGARLLQFVDLATGCGLIGFGGLVGYRSVHDQ